MVSLLWFGFLISCFMLKVYPRVTYVLVPLFVCFLKLFLCTPVCHKLIPPCLFSVVPSLFPHISPVFILSLFSPVIGLIHMALGFTLHFCITP